MPLGPPAPRALLVALAGLLVAVLSACSGAAPTPAPTGAPTALSPTSAAPTSGTPVPPSPAAPDPTTDPTPAVAVAGVRYADPGGKYVLTVPDGYTPASADEPQIPDPLRAQVRAGVLRAWLDRTTASGSADRYAPTIGVLCTTVASRTEADLVGELTASMNRSANPVAAPRYTVTAGPNGPRLVGATTPGSGTPP